MALTECTNGHLYDTDQYASCPYCQGGINRVEFGGGDSGVGKTVGIGTPGGAPITSEIGATVAPAGYRTQSKGNDDTGKTVAVLQKSLKVEPVVGWIVCVEGKDNCLLKRLPKYYFLLWMRLVKYTRRGLYTEMLLRIIYI